MSTPINLIFKKGHDYLFAYCRHDGDAICENLKNASKADLEFIYNEINSRKNLEHTYVDSIYGTKDNEDADVEGVVCFVTEKFIDNAIIRFRADNSLIKKPINEIVQFIENTQDIEVYDVGGWTVWVDFDAEMVAGNDEYRKAPKFKPMKKKDIYSRSAATNYDTDIRFNNKRKKEFNSKLKAYKKEHPNDISAEFHTEFSKMGMRGMEMDNDSGYDGMEENFKARFTDFLMESVKDVEDTYYEEADKWLDDSDGMVLRYFDKVYDDTFMCVKLIAGGGEFGIYCFKNGETERMDSFDSEKLYEAVAKFKQYEEMTAKELYEQICIVIGMARNGR